MIVNLAPLSNPTNVKVPLIWVFEGANKVLIVVPLKLNWVPITVFETFVGLDSGARLTIPITINYTT